MKITVAGVGYVGLSLAVLFAQHHEVTAITTTPKKADKLNDFISPIQDDEIERFFREAKEGKRELNLHTTVDKDAAYRSAELVVIATPTNYDDEHHFFDTSAVEGAIERVHEERYRKLLANIQEGIVFSRDGDVIWQCSNCGHIVIGPKAPEVCPVCDHPQSYFQLKPENY